MQSMGNGGRSLKDRLREQAREAEEQKRVRRESALRDEALYSVRLQPAMLAAADYFRDIVADLQTIGSEAAVDIALGSRRDRRLVFHQSDYSFFVDDESAPKELSVTCLCRMADTTIHVGSTREADELEQRFRDMGLNFHRRRQEDLIAGAGEASRFIIDGEFSASFTMRADSARERIVLQTQNLEDQPLRQYALRPERVHEALFENLGLLLLRENDTLIRTEVAPELRQQLRSTIDRDEALKRRNPGLRGGYADKSAAGQAESSVGDRVKEATQKVTGRIRQYTRRRPAAPNSSDRES